METLGDFIREMNFAPTLKGKIPTDLLTNSVSVHDIDETDMETVETLQIEMAKWIKSVNRLRHWNLLMTKYCLQSTRV